MALNISIRMLPFQCVAIAITYFVVYFTSVRLALCESVSIATQSSAREPERVKAITATNGTLALVKPHAS